MWGVIPAAGIGSRIQPLAFSKELLPVGARLEAGTERPRAVCEYLIDRMLLAGVNKICFVISPGKSDIVEYFGARVSSRAGAADLCYVIQPGAGGLCDALFRAIPLIGGEEEVVIGLPDTIWFPENGLQALPAGVLAFLLFPVDRPELFDAVITADGQGEEIREIQVKQPAAGSNWIWGAFRMPAQVFNELYNLWLEPARGDEYIGTLVNAYLGNGGRAVGVRAGEAYVDVGTLHGYRNAIQLLAGRPASGEGWVIDAKRRGRDQHKKPRMHEEPRREFQNLDRG
ncbi:MAG: sugar phosphate nucleotidyltransferase [Phycisphaerae bacterium]